MIPTADPSAAGKDKRRSVHLQTQYGGATGGCQTLYHCGIAGPFEVIRPDLFSRIEQWYFRPGIGINRTGCLMLVIVAIPTRKAQVIKVVTAIWINVIDLHCLTCVRLASLAIFTTATGSPVHAITYVVPGGITHRVRENHFARSDVPAGAVDGPLQLCAPSHGPPAAPVVLALRLRHP